jgi:ribosomal protein RSM22 (predicted rRNA methylase)
MPDGLKSGIDGYLAEMEAGSLVEKSARMSQGYRQGRGSGKSLDFGAYLVARLPATFAAIGFCLSELGRRLPQFSPRSILDAGSGPGTAAWAATTIYQDISHVTFMDSNLRFLQLASRLAAGSDHPALRQAEALLADLGSPFPQTSADLVVAALALWQACAGTLLIIEPGTPQGFARINQTRSVLMTAGASLVAPCTHMNACPMLAPDWCHFSVRLQRSREHMHAKQAKVSFEDEKFSYLIASRRTSKRHGARHPGKPKPRSRSGSVPKMGSSRGILRHVTRRNTSGSANWPGVTYLNSDEGKNQYDQKTHLLRLKI